MALIEYSHFSPDKQHSLFDDKNVQWIYLDFHGPTSKHVNELKENPAISRISETKKDAPLKNQFGHITVRATWDPAST